MGRLTVYHIIGFDVKFLMRAQNLICSLFLPGANVEIFEEIGEENIFIFGARANEVEDLRHANRYRRPAMHPELDKVLQTIYKGTFGNPKVLQPLICELQTFKIRRTQRELDN